MGGLPLDTAAIMSTTLEAILYGFSVLMFIGTFVALTRKRRVQDVNRLIASVAILLLILSTAHMVIDIIRLQVGLVQYRSSSSSLSGPSAFFADVTQPTYVAKNAIYILQTLLADGVVIYRCYIVWQSMGIIVMPTLLWCSSAVTGFYGVYRAAQATENPGNIFAKATGQWITAFFSSTLATNLMSSGLLAYRIWRIERSVSVKRTSVHGPTMPILRVLMDAAVLYSVVLFTLLICFVCSSNGQYVILDMIMPIIAIAFYMVLIRVAINQRSNSLFSSVRAEVTHETQRSSRHFAMKPLEVHISQFRQNDGSPPYVVENHDRVSTQKGDEESYGS